eukprot:354517-Chlamydomonas_euryale.AAC.2
MECAVVLSGHTEAIWSDCAHSLEASERRGPQWNTTLGLQNPHKLAPDVQPTCTCGTYSWAPLSVDTCVHFCLISHLPLHTSTPHTHLRHVVQLDGAALVGNAHKGAGCAGHKLCCMDAARLLAEAGGDGTARRFHQPHLAAREAQLSRGQEQGWRCGVVVRGEGPQDVPERGSTQDEPHLP